MLKLQAEELEQSLDERRQDREQRQREQASRVFMLERWGPPVPRVDQGKASPGETLAPSVTVEVHNTSNRPIYELRISWQLSGVLYGQWERPQPLMPGDEDAWNEPIPTGATREVFSAVTYFRDAARVTWRLQPDGHLDPISPDQEPPRDTF